MSTRDDVMTTAEPPDRLFYAEGVFLDAADLSAEQVYHRGRLARVLDYLHGHGTAAGLEVLYEEATDDREERLTVEPGIAVDRVGRLIEIPQRWCIRFDRWFSRPVPSDPDASDPDTEAHHAALVRATTGTAAGDETTVTVDLYLRFDVCERGLTPAFASGPRDATNAVQPSRLRDAFTLSLHVRDTGRIDDSDTDLLPIDPWGTVEEPGGGQSRSDRFRAAVLSAWRHGTADFSDGQPNRPSWHPLDLDDPSAVFLARLSVPVTVPGGGEVPTRVVTGPDTVAPATLDQLTARPIVLSNAALAQWLSR